MQRHEDAALVMEREFEDAVGERAEGGDELRTPRGLATVLRENRLLIGVLGAVVIVLGAMVGLVLDSVLFVVLALVVHLGATFFIAMLAIRLAGDVEKPDPMVVARLQAAGVADPESALNDAIKAHSGATHGLTDDAERTDDSPGRAAAQSESMTPSSVPTELVGPGSAGSLRDGA